MHYCEVTPRNNRGIVHLKTVVFLNNYNLKFDRNSKVLYCIDCISGESVEISPIYEYKLVEDSKHRSRNYYKFKVALKLIGDSVINHKEVNLSNSKFFEKEGCDSEVSKYKELIQLLYIDNKVFDLLKGFEKGENEFKEVKISNSNKIIWTKFQIGCRDLIILEDNLLSIDIRKTKAVFCLVFRIGIKIDRRLNFLDLKVASLSCLSDTDSLKDTKNLLLRCKRCGIDFDSLTDFKFYSLPSDLYLNSIGSIYCEECQDNLTNAKSNTLEDNIELTHKHKILYLSDETLTINHSLGGKHTYITSNKDSNTNNSNINKDKNTNNNTNNIDNSNKEEERVIGCSNCKEVIGYITNKSVTYFKNRICGISEGIDIFWRYTEYIEYIEKIQFSELINLKISSGLECIEIIKVTKEPDTFIFINNNPVIVSRILYKIDKKENKNSIDNSSNKNKDKNNSNKNNNNSKYKLGEEIDNRLFGHIKYLLLLFSHDQDNSEWIASLLPQI